MCCAGPPPCPPDPLEEGWASVPFTFADLLFEDESGCRALIDLDGGEAEPVLTEERLFSFVEEGSCPLETFRTTPLYAQWAAAGSSGERTMVAFAVTFDGCAGQSELRDAWATPDEGFVLHFIAEDLSLSPGYAGDCPLTGYESSGLVVVEARAPELGWTTHVSKVAVGTCGIDG